MRPSILPHWTSGRHMFPQGLTSTFLFCKTFSYPTNTFLKLNQVHLFSRFGRQRLGRSTVMVWPPSDPHGLTLTYHGASSGRRRTLFFYISQTPELRFPWFKMHIMSICPLDVLCKYDKLSSGTTNSFNNIQALTLGIIGATFAIFYIAQPLELYFPLFKVCISYPMVLWMHWVSMINLLSYTTILLTFMQIIPRFHRTFTKHMFLSCPTNAMSKSKLNDNHSSNTMHIAI